MIGRTATHINQLSRAAQGKTVSQQAKYCSVESESLTKEHAVETEESVSRKEICHECTEPQMLNDQVKEVSGKKTKVKKNQLRLKRAGSETNESPSTLNQRSRAIRKSNTTVIQVKKSLPKSNSGGLQVNQQDEYQLCQQATGVSEETQTEITRGQTSNQTLIQQSNDPKQTFVSTKQQLQIIVQQLKTYLFDLTCLLPLVQSEKNGHQRSMTMPSLPYLFFFAEMLNTMNQQASLHEVCSIQFETSIRPLLLFDYSTFTISSESLKEVQNALLKNNLMKFASHLFVSLNISDTQQHEATLNSLLRMQNARNKEDVCLDVQHVQGMRLVQKIIDNSFKMTAKTK